MTRERSASPKTQGPGQEIADPGVEGNARLTSSNAAVLIALLAVEGVTILSIRPLLSPHVFVGMLLIPPVALKTGSTLYRFLRYYQGAPAYRRKGPPAWALRLLGPLVVVLTVVVLASGVGLLFVADPWRQRLLLVHKASFVLWFGVMTIHVLGHLAETGRLAFKDWIGRPGRRWPRAAARRWTLVASLVTGALLGWWLLGRVGAYLATSGHGHHGG
ncbi:MAG TPA: hypothetical protein VH112_12990 [Acidimicrobiales bacterium]|jgi:hypothetical protein|nr:hypothetical protein [Acidimicrobiales bacterium]